MKRDLIVNHLIISCHKLKSTRNFPLYRALQSKNKSNKKMREMFSSDFSVSLYDCKIIIKKRYKQI